MNFKHYILLSIAAIIELIAIFLLYYTQFKINLFLIFIMHLISSLISSIVGFIILPDRFKKDKKYTFIFLFVFAFTLSILSIPAFIIFSQTLYKQKDNDKDYYDTLFIDKLLILDEIKLQKRFLGEGGIDIYIKNKNLNPNLRLKAFLIISEITSPLSVEYFKLGLSDTNDEIRLLSFSQINSLEKKINNEIFSLNQKLKENPDNIDIKVQIAKLNWEIVYLRLADETFEKIILKKIIELLDGIETEDALYLLLKIYIKQKDYQKADEIIKKLGINLETVQYALEIEYYKKNYKKVVELIKAHPDIRLLERFDFIYRLWNGS